MNNLTKESGDCLICFSKIENYDALLPGQEYNKIVDNCWNYLHKNIANIKLQTVKSEIENQLPLCKKCFDAVSELTQLKEVVIKSEKKISNLSFEFSLGVLYRRTQVENVNNLPDGQISPKDLIVLDVSRMSPSLFSTDQPNPTEIEDFENPCQDKFIGMDTALNDPQHIFEVVKIKSEEAVDDESAESEDDTNITRDEDFPVYTRPVVVSKTVNDPQRILEIVQHESEELVDEESAESEDDINITRDEELQAQTRHVVVLKRLKEANVSKKFNCNTNSSPQHPDYVTNQKHQLRNESCKKVGQSSSSKIIQGQTGPANVKQVKQSVSSLEVRGRVGTGKKQHKCPECEKVFSFASYLKNHIRVHTGEMFRCSFCAKTFTQFSNIQVHLRIHTGERPFKCSHCTKDFTQLSILQRHERIHTGEKPFKCSFCKQAFRQLSHLKSHESVQTGEKPFECFHCTKTFAHSCSLKYHLRVHHTGKKTS